MGNNPGRCAWTRATSSPRGEIVPLTYAGVGGRSLRIVSFLRRARSFEVESGEGRPNPSCRLIPSVSPAAPFYVTRDRVTAAVGDPRAAS